MPPRSARRAGPERPRAGSRIRAPGCLLRQARHLRPLLPDPRGLLREPRRPLCRRRGRPDLQRALHDDSLGARRARAAGKESALLGPRRHSAERDRHALRHGRCNGRRQPFQGRFCRIGRPRQRTARRGDEAAVEPRPLQRRIALVLDFNFRPDRVTRNLHLRKALQLVNDPGELVNKVIAIPGYRPAASLFPSWLTGINGPFRQEYPPPAVTPDVAKAREHLEIAKRELGLDGHPAIGAADRRLADSPTRSRSTSRACSSGRSASKSGSTSRSSSSDSQKTTRR